MLRKEEILLIIYFILVILFLAGFTVLFFITYQRRKNKILKEKYEAEQNFKAELSNVKLEIQEATLKNVSWELHDNIGQLLAIASMQLNILSKKVDEATHTTVNDVKDLVANSLSEIRALSRSLNNEVIDYVGLEASVKNEIERFNRLAVLEAKIEIKGTPFMVSQEDSIILFRIIQEFLSNTIKYASASKLHVNFIYGRDVLKIIIEDNGKGFNIEETKAGSGLLNMRSRAEIINAGFLLKSSPGNGTYLTLTYPTKIITNE
ncbi:sensor histidine kinase [Christiangramia sabulilitoris]|uniref:histidine kinase n=1 Tax=Christiangramia sabulilitoris TaxID=2583991 RepID=A0A550I311_9FLAO|nr:ATP-binding protein [Christiangramia sabulilitoris]TRO65188.1 histidine kinase [Christiangramia sabulilitoris]